MRLSIESWRLRQEARRAVAAGEFSEGFELAGKAQNALGTEAGVALLAVCEWLRG